MKPRSSRSAWRTIGMTVAAAAPLAGLPAPASFAEEFLGPSRLATELGGKTIKGYYVATRINFIETYQADGRISYVDDLKGDAGSWTVRGTAFCTFYDNINGGCWYVIKRSGNCFEFYPAPITGDMVTHEELKQDQPHALAARDSDKVTCDAWFGS